MQSIVRKAVRPFTVVLKGIILTLIICATCSAWADLVAKWGPGDFPVSNAGSYDNMTSEKSGLTLSKNNGGNTSTADYMMIATSGGWPLTITGTGVNYGTLTVVMAYSLASGGDNTGVPISYTTARGANTVYSYMESGAMYAGWWNGTNNKYGDLKVTTPANETIHYLVFAYSKTNGTYMYYDGATSASASGYYGNSGLKAGDSGTISGNTTEIVLGAQRDPKQIINGMKVHYVAVYNSSLTGNDVQSSLKAAFEAVHGASSFTPDVDASNNAVIDVTDDTSYFVASATTYNSITFNVASGKTVNLYGATLTGTNGITVNGGTVKLLTANTQLSGALAGTGTVAYPAGTLPSGVTYSANWTGTIWVKGLQGNQARNFDSYGQGTSKVKISGITGYLDSNPTITFSRELVLDDDTYGFAMKLGNGNSPGTDDSSKNRCAIFKKLSGDGTFTAGGSTGGYGAYSWSVIRIIDSSEFTGTINCQVESGAQLGGVIFSEEDEEMPDTMYNMFNPNTKRIFVSAGCKVANGNAVTVPAGKTWVAQGGIDVRGDLIVNGTLNATIVNNAGSITVNPGATVPAQGSKRDFTGWIVADGASISITQTVEEYGKGVTTVTGVEKVSSITVLDPSGAVAGTIIPATSTSATLNTAVKTAGKACWCDWEMNGDLSNAGTDTTGLSYDTNMNAGNSFYNSQMLYTYTHPYCGVTYPSTWTAVVRCTVPKVANGAVITFGTNSGGLIGLIAGDNPEEEMKLIKTTGNVQYETLAKMPIVNGTTAQHVYVFAVENNSTIKVYCDGSEVLNKTYPTFTLGGGIQVGSVHGGIYDTGITAVWKGNTYAGLTEDDLKEARIDCVRLYDYSLSAAQIAALSVEFPAIVVYRATAAANTDTTWTGGTLAWSPAWTGGNDQSKVILTTEGDARISLPETITANQLQLLLATDSTLTLTGPGSITVTEPVDISGGTLKLTGTVTLTRDTAFNGKVSFVQFTKTGDGAIKLSKDTTVSVDAALVVTPLDTYTCAEGTVVDSAYTGDGVKLIPLTSAVVSITQNGTTLYYSDLDTGVGKLNVIDDVSDDVCCVLLNGATWPTTPYDYAGILRTMGYYIDGNGTLTKAVARISSTPYPTLAAAIEAASNGATVTLLLASSEAITLNKAITLDENGKAFKGTLTGTGTLTFAAFRNNPSITFDNWTGSVVLPSFAADGTILNKYGVTGSTVVLKGITSGWLGETSTQRMDVNPVLQLDGNVTITGFSTAWTYTFAEITGTGTFSLSPVDANHPKAASITKVAKGFAGTVESSINPTLTIGTLDRAADTTVSAGSKLLSTSSAVQASALTLAGVATSITPVFDTDGLYVKAASVTKNGTTTNYDTVSAAMTAAGTDAATIKLLMPTDSAIALAPGQTLVNGNLTSGNVSGSVNGVVIINDSGTYTVVDNRKSTWEPVDSSTDWSAEANWSTGYVPTQYTAVTIPASKSVTLPATIVCASITVGNGATLNLSGNVAYSAGTITGAINFTGTGTFTCGAANTLQGTVKGESTVTVEYPAHTLPTGADWSNSAWTGTLVLTDCGREQNTHYPNGEEHGTILFNQYGNSKSTIKAPGYCGISAGDDQNERCDATLIIDNNTTFELNHGTGASAIDTKGAGFRFAKLSGSGLLKLDGTSDTAQYIFDDVDGFTGSVWITFPEEGGRKSFLFGAAHDYTIGGEAYAANLVIVSDVTVAANKIWTIPAGVIITRQGKLTLSDGSTITALSPRSEGTLSVAAGATATLTGVTNGVVTAKLEIPSDAKLYITDTSLDTLTIPAGYEGTVNLASTTIKTLHVTMGDETSFDLSKVTLPSTCTAIYYDIGSKRDLNGYSELPARVTAFFADETIAEYGGTVFRVINVPAGATVRLNRRSGTPVDINPTGESTTREYSGGRIFAGAACWHEWDFESQNLEDSGKCTLETPTVSAVPLVITGSISSYSEANVGNEVHYCIPVNVYPTATTGAFTNPWGAAIRCTMPTTVNTVAIAFGDTDNGVLGLATGGQSGIVELFNWTSGEPTVLARLQVESPEKMHIYAFAVNDGSVTLYRDGELIHTAAFALKENGSINKFMVGAISGDDGTILTKANNGAVDYVRLYDKTLDATMAEGLAARRPFISAHETYVRTVSSGQASWSDTGAWHSITNDSVVVDKPVNGTHVTLSAPDGASMQVNVGVGVTNTYETLIFKGDDTITLIPVSGKITANMVVVRTPVEVNWGTADFSTSMLGVAPGASLTFDLSNYPFETEVQTTKDVKLTGVVVAKEYDSTVTNRISVVGAPDTGFFTITPKWGNDNCFYATIARNYKTFTVEVPANTVVTVNGDAYTAGTQLSFPNNAQVTIAYSAAEGYVATGYPQQIITVRPDTPNSIAATEGTVTSAVAKIGTTYYTALQDAVSVGGNVTLLQDLNLTTGITVDGGKSVTLDLNGKSINFTSKGKENKFFVKNATLNFVNSSETLSIVKEQSPDYSPVMVYGNTTESEATTVVTVGANVKLEGWAGIFVNNNPGEDGKVGKNAGVRIEVNGTLLGCNDGAGNANSFGHGLYVSGNVVDSVTVLVGETANISSDGAAVYAAGVVDMTVNGGTITGDKSGIELRAGSLAVNGGTIASTAGSFSATANGNGSTVVGAAVAVSPHNTNKDVLLNVTGGTFTGVKAVYENYLQTQERTAETGLALSGGTFNGAVESVNETGFISGGMFNAAVDLRYCDSGFIPAYDATTGKYGVKSGYVVKFVNYDNTVLAEVQAEKYTPPVYAGNTPTKPATVEYTYTFSGWTDGTTSYGVGDELPAVTGAVTYTATYTGTLNTKTFTVQVPNNTTVSVTGATDNGNDTYTAEIGAKVTITYAADGAFVASGTQSKIFTVDGETADTIAAPSDYAVTPAVAKIGTTYYTTLQDAVDAVDTNSETLTMVKILCSQTLTGKLVVTGRKVDFEADDVVEVVGQLRVVDGSAVTIGSSVTFTSAEHPTVFMLGDPAVNTPGTKKSTLTVIGTVLNTNETFDQTFAISGNGSDTQGVDITVTGTVRNTNGIAIYQPQPGNLVVNGTVEGASAITIKDGTLTINDGAVVRATYATYAGHATDGNGASPSGDAIQVPYYPAAMGYGTPAVSIKGGTITVVAPGASGIQAYDNNNVVAPEDSASNINVEGGTFNAPLALEYCDEGFMPVYDEGNGTYGVTPGVAVAEVDGVYYTSLEDALTAATENNQPITLLRNVAVAETSVSEAATIDLNGKTLSGSIVLTARVASVTVSGGTFTAEVSTNVSGGATVISTTSDVATTYKVVYGTIFSVW